MTNREAWEKSIHDMTDEEFSFRLAAGTFQREIGERLCEWCKKAYPGRVCSMENNCPDETEYLKAEVAS